ncbi:MAG: hypothetical protein, partial [Olavius algarvensis Gamma 1 endosymbiont]
HERDDPVARVGAAGAKPGLEDFLGIGTEGQERTLPAREARSARRVVRGRRRRERLAEVAKGP